MTGLFEKDLRLILTRKSTLVLLLIIGIVVTWEFSSGFSVSYLTILGTILAISTISYDDTDNCMEFIFTLPCTRKQYVIEKYLFVYGLSLLAGLIGIVIIITANIFKGIPVNATLFIEIVLSALPILAITGGIMIPLQLKFGAEKSRIVLLLLIGIIFIIGFILSKIPGLEGFIASVGEIINSANAFSLLLLMVSVLIILSIISILISMKIVVNKEL